MSYTVGDTATVLVDHESLAYMLRICSEPENKVALIGFNEYAKHLLNLAPSQVVCIYDQEEWKQGIRFRGKSVIPSNQAMDINSILVCDFAQLYDFAGKIRYLYDNKIKVLYPPRLHYVDTTDIDVSKQDPVYSSIDIADSAAPPSMMNDRKLFFLAELMRAGLKNDGDIVEMGVYQAGSVWYLAHVLKNLGESREIFMMDLFEQHMMHPNATMCNDEIVKRLSFYPNCRLLEGLVDNKILLDQIGNRDLCFVHYDLGYHEKALEFIWDRLQPGSPVVLDNYGHLAIDPWDLDSFFSRRGAHVIRNLWSEQGVVFKPADRR